LALQFSTLEPEAHILRRVEKISVAANLPGTPYFGFDAIEMNPNNVMAWQGKGTALYHLRRHNESIQYFDKVIEMAPMYYRSYYYKGNVHARLGTHEHEN
jgi:tetratricopeptide (TPR) repeat protein